MWRRSPRGPSTTSRSPAAAPGGAPSAPLAGAPALACLLAGPVAGGPDAGIDALHAVDEQHAARRRGAGTRTDRRPGIGLVLDRGVDRGFGTLGPDPRPPPRDGVDLRSTHHRCAVHRRPVVGRPGFDGEPHIPIMDSGCDK